MGTNSERKDHWDHQAYKSAAGFVPKLTTKVVSYLDVQPNDRILDIGCGDAQLTAIIAQNAKNGEVLGIDSSKSFINTAIESYTSSNSSNKIPNLSFLLHDATDLQSCPQALNGNWDKIFSNAAMHWILRNESTRTAFFTNVYKCLKPGGTFIFEQGGKGNVAEIHTAAISALVHAGLPVQQAREASPWFFPSVPWMEKTLKEAGFEVEVCEMEYRPSPINKDGGGLEAWVKLMCAEFLDVAPDGKKESVLREICESVETVVTREEDGSQFLGYVRLRGVGRKK